MEEEELKTEVNFQLSEPLLYGNKNGEQSEGTFIHLTAPTSKHYRECATLKQAFFRSIPQDQTQEEKTEEEEPTPMTAQDVIVILSMSKGAELADVYEVAKRLLTNGVAQIDGQVKLKSLHVEKMSQDDFEKMVGEYLVNFTLASSLRAMREKSSAAS